MNTGVGKTKTRNGVSRWRNSVWWCMGAAIGFVFIFSYLPTLRELVDTWEKEPDYSHGYLVIPLSLAFLWIRRDSFPGWRPRIYLGGLLLIGISIAMRVAGRALFLNPVDGWSIAVWAAGATWLIFGLRVLYWATPSIAFLIFMVPLPFRMETWLSIPLQKVATKVSCFALQLMGQPALTEGNVIFLGEQQLFVAEACSGMRIFIGILALAFAYLVLIRRSWWERILLLAAVLPIAVFANVSRIVLTAVLYQLVSGEVAHQFSHDWTGFVMIPYAAAIFAIVIWYVGRLVPQVELLDVGQALRAKSSSD